MIKKIPALITLLFLLLISTIPSYAAQEFETGFSDVPCTHWAAEKINFASNKKWVSGYDDGTFRPDNLLTRAELAAILARAGRVPPLSPATPSFLDTGTDQWFSSSVEAVKGYFAADPSLQNGLFRPHDPVTRQEAAAIMVLATGDSLAGANPDEIKGVFTDYEVINPVYRPYVALAVKKGLIKGYPEGYFRPDTPLTRSEAVSLIFKVFHNDITIYGLLTSGAVKSINQSSEAYQAAKDVLNSQMGHLDGVELQYYINPLPFGETSEDKLVFIFARVDPFKYFSFTEAIFTPEPEKVREFAENIAAEVSRNYPSQRILAVIGYSNLTFYSTTPETFSEEYTSYIPEEDSWKVERFYAAAMGLNGNILESWLESLY